MQLVFILSLMSLMYTVSQADFVSTCIDTCRSNRTTFEGFDESMNCMCGGNCNNFIAFDACQDQCVDVVNATYTYTIDPCTLCDVGECRCTCPPRVITNTHQCKQRCIDIDRQYISFQVKYNEKADCYIDNCTCGLPCPPTPITVEDCPPIKDKRAKYVSFGGDQYLCQANQCHYVDCEDHTIEDFCWMTCPPFTYPQGCFVETDACTECVCDTNPPTFNSCDLYPDRFPIVFDADNCQKHCDTTYGKTRRQGVALSDKCECVSLTDKFCNSVCVAEEQRHGSAVNANRQCLCTNLPSYKPYLRRRCTAVCRFSNKTWAGTTNGQLCVCR